MNFLNILIEDAETLEYLGNNGRWTKEVLEGKTFGTTQTAYVAAKKEPIGKFNIVGYFSPTQQFVNLSHGSGKGRDAALVPVPAT